MVTGDTNFESALVAGLSLALGGAYVVVGSFDLMGSLSNTHLLLSGSTVVTLIVGVLLLLGSGIFLAGSSFARYYGILAFGTVVVFGRPSLAAPTVVDVGQASIALLTALYLVLRDPVPTSQRADVDEETSGTRVGSTLR